MSDRTVFKADVRQETGSKVAAKLRKQGKMPAIVYGHGKDSIAVALDSHAFVGGLHHGVRLLDLDMDGKSETVMIKELQYDHLGKDVIHADLVRVNLAEKVTVSVAVELKGIAVGAGEGGMVDQQLTMIEVECGAGNIPQSVTVPIKALAIDDVIHASDIELPAGVTLVTDADTVVVSCHVVAETKTTEELAEEMPEGPEVITEKAEEPAKD